MVSLTSFTGITACILLLQSCTFAAPVNEKPTLARRATTTGRFLHISDIHIDPNYKKGADVDDYCHVYSKKRSSDTAGTFGALGTDCDTPPALAKATFDYLKSNVNDIDFIVYTGDTVRHDRDDKLPRTDAEVVAGHKSVLKYFQSAYDVSTIPVIPTIGNNDPYDHNTVEKKDSLFKKLESIWAPLDLNLNSDFTNGGYFVQEVIKNKLSIINVNTMYFFEKNDGVKDCSSSSSPAATQMKWLESTLKTYSAKDGHQVYLMGHVPPIDEDGEALYKDSCYDQYFKLLGKYGNVIAGHFTGHTNKDTLSAVYKKKSKYTFMNPDSDDASKSKSALKKTVLGLFNGPSILPKNNPGFRIYTYETEGSDYPVGTILDWEQYYVDLEKANDANKVDYQLEYTASSLYNVDHFDGAGVGTAVYNVAKDDDALDNYKDYIKVDP